MSGGNSNQHYRNRIRQLSSTLALAQQALKVAAPVTNALFDYFKANEACQPDPAQIVTVDESHALSEKFLKARAEVLKILESVNMGVRGGNLVSGERDADV